MEQKLTNAEFAILGLLVEKPCHGYDLERLIEERGMREWTELAFSSIYYILKKLETRDIVEHLPQQPDTRKTRKTYAPTKQGYCAHQEMTLSLLAQPRSTYPPILLGLANWPAVDRNKALNALWQRKVTLNQTLGKLAEKSGFGPPFVEVLFDYSIGQIKSELQWLDEALVKLGENP